MTLQTTFKLDQCEIRVPRQSELAGLYDLLWDIFEIDRPFIEKILSGTASYYNWNPLCLFYDGKIIGNVAITDMQIWSDGALRKFIGIASVATAEDYRNRGVAGRLLQNLFESPNVVQNNQILFTSIPDFYSKFGFRTVEQNYLTTVANPDMGLGGCHVRCVHECSKDIVSRMKHIYTDLYPCIDGKMLRDDDYWDYYCLAFNINTESRLFFAQNASTAGYVRCEYEQDRVLVTEFCCEPDDWAVVESLNGAIHNYASQDGLKITYALGQNHFLWKTYHEAALKPETDKVRESFMISSGNNILVPGLDNLQWCLADKF